MKSEVNILVEIQILFKKFLYNFGAHFLLLQKKLDFIIVLQVQVEKSKIEIVRGVKNDVMMKKYDIRKV